MSQFSRKKKFKSQTRIGGDFQKNEEENVEKKFRIKTQNFLMFDSKYDIIAIKTTTSTCSSLSFVGVGVGVGVVAAVVTRSQIKIHCQTFLNEMGPLKILENCENPHLDRVSLQTFATY